MNFKPILFSTEMVKAILSGSKVQTRRVVKPQPNVSVCTRCKNDIESCECQFKSDGEANRCSKVFEISDVKCPYGQVGDVLWVRETWLFCQDCYSSELTRFGRGYYLHKETGHNPRGNKWKPSIHMPKEACRLFLKIKSIRVERLQDISEEDSLAEGIHGEEGSVSKRKWYRKFVSEDEARSKGLFTESAKECFQSLWHSINGEESWESNPWVWVIEFEQIEKPEGF